MLGSSLGLSLRAWTLRLGGEKGTSWKEQRTIICRSGRCGGDVTETDEEKIVAKQAVRHRVAPEAEAWFLDYAAMQEAAVCVVLRTVMGRSLACH